MAKRYKYRYLRTRADGSSNETTSQRSFEKWFAEIEAGDEFFVARLEWVQCEQDGVVPWKNTKGDVSDLPHVSKTGDASSVDNLK